MSAATATRSTRASRSARGSREARASRSARATRPSRATRDGAAPTRRVRAVRAAVGMAVLALLAGAVWALTSGAGSRVVPAADELALPGGVARVEQVASAARPMMAMPGMGTDTDPVADGERRLSVEVTVLSTGRASVDVDPDDFTLQVPGLDPRSPHRSMLPATVLPPGSRLSGTLVYDVPVDADAAVLAHVEGSSLPVDLPPEAPQSPVPSGAEHENHGSDTDVVADEHEQGGAP